MAEPEDGFRGKKDQDYQLWRIKGWRPVIRFQETGRQNGNPDVLQGENVMALFLKWVLVLTSLSGGALFLARAIGVEIPFIKYEGLEAHGVPVGIALLAVGVALAVLWKVKTITTVEESHIENSSDGSSSEYRKTLLSGYKVNRFN